MSDRNKIEINQRVQARYDELMLEGKHGHYETMFRVVHEELERLDEDRIFIDTVLPDGWIWTIRKFHNHPWADCGYAEAYSPHEEPLYKAYGHTPSLAFRALLDQIK